MQKIVNTRNHGLVLFNPEKDPYQVLPLWARVDLGAMALKEYSAFPKAPGNLIIRLFSVISRTLVGGLFPRCRETVGIFCSPSRPGN